MQNAVLTQPRILEGDGSSVELACEVVASPRPARMNIDASSSSSLQPAAMTIQLVAKY
jgi:hypothetical protein